MILLSYRTMERDWHHQTNWSDTSYNVGARPYYWLHVNSDKRRVTYPTFWTILNGKEVGKLPTKYDNWMLVSLRNIHKLGLYSIGHLTRNKKKLHLIYRTIGNGITEENKIMYYNDCVDSPENSRETNNAGLRRLGTIEQRKREK